MKTEWQDITTAGVDLGNKIAEIIDCARAQDIPMDEIVCVVASVAADYGRMIYGDDYLDALAEVVLRRREAALPEVTVQ